MQTPTTPWYSTALLAGAKRVILLHRHTMSDIWEAIVFDLKTKNRTQTITLRLAFERTTYHPVEAGGGPRARCVDAGRLHTLAYTHLLAQAHWMLAQAHWTPRLDRGVYMYFLPPTFPQNEHTCTLPFHSRIYTTHY